MSEQIERFDYVSVPWKSHRRDGYVMKILESGKVLVEMIFIKPGGYKYRVYRDFPAEQVQILRKSTPD